MIEQTLIKTLGFGSREFIEKAIEGGWTNYSVCQAIAMFERNGFSVFVNGFGWVVLHDKTEEPNGGLFQRKADSFRKEQILLDPAAWKACGKTERWHQSCVANSHEGGCEMCWHKGMHSFISALAEEESSKA